MPKAGDLLCFPFGTLGTVYFSHESYVWQHHATGGDDDDDEILACVCVRMFTDTYGLLLLPD